jgi:hypothetical protein
MPTPPIGSEVGRLLPKKPADRPIVSVGLSARFSSVGKTQYGVPFPATGAVGTLGSGDGIGIEGKLAASSSLGLSFTVSAGLGISFGGTLPPAAGGTTTAGGTPTPGMAYGAAQQSGAGVQQSFPRR